MTSPGIKLWVDDLRVAPQGWVLARTITEAVRMLSTLKVDEISLDHDIMLIDERGSWTGKNSAENYTAIAWFIRQMPELERPRTVWVHTANPDGAIAIRNILEGYVDTVIRDATFQHEWGTSPMVKRK